jgi:dihydropteroate synthase
VRRTSENEYLISVPDLDRDGLRIEMRRMQVHDKGVKIMLPKAQFRTVKIKGLPVTQANIIKQDMLSFGGDAATAMGTINHSIKKTDILIFGTFQQFKNLTSKLKHQYFGLKKIAGRIDEALADNDRMPKPMRIGGKTFNFNKRTYIMGILNVTPDSFSDGGKFINFNDAVAHGRKMLEDGADIIDVGGESTRPGASPVSVAEEINRVIPVIKELAKIKGAVISIDTTKSKVAEAAIKAGASMINDVSALRFDKNIAKVAARHNAPLVLMHMLGNPRVMQGNPVYGDLISDIISCLQNSISIAIKGGAQQNRIIVDPGFGFGKTVEHNLEILRRLKELKVLGSPIMIGTSRKSTIGRVLGLPPDKRLEGTAATVALSIANGANIVRVHDVAEMSRVAKMADAIYRKQGMKK